jgi:ParB family chromosome partitioning protein
MANPRNALGRGLDALIAAPRYTQVHDDYMLCPLERIAPDPNQPRQHFDDEALDGLCQSMREHGVIQPLVVRQVGEDYVLIAGERRYRAAKRIGLETVPVVIRDVSDDETLELALIENLQRQDLNPMEEAQAYKRLLERPGMTQDRVARRLGRSRSSIANALRLLALAPAHRSMVVLGTLSPGHARTLLSLEDEEDRDILANRIVEGQLSVRDAEASAHALKAATRAQRPGPRRHPLAPYCEGIAGELTASLGAQVRVQVRGRKGRIEIPFDGIEDLRRLRDLLTI